MIAIGARGQDRMGTLESARHTSGPSCLFQGNMEGWRAWGNMRLKRKHLVRVKAWTAWTVDMVAKPPRPPLENCLFGLRPSLSPDRTWPGAVTPAGAMVETHGA